MFNCSSLLLYAHYILGVERERGKKGERGGGNGGGGGQRETEIETGEGDAQTGSIVPGVRPFPCAVPWRAPVA